MEIEPVDLQVFDTRGIISSYILGQDGSYAIVDPGPRSTNPNLLSHLDDRGIPRDEVEALLATHIHIDHAGGAGELMDDLPNADLYVHPIAVSHVKEPDFLWESTKKVLGSLAERYGEIRPAPHERVVSSQDGDSITLGGEEIEVVHTPGHATHHVCYLADGELMTGDAGGMVFSDEGNVVPTTPPPNFDLEAWKDSLDRCMALEPEKLNYSHFGSGTDAVSRLSRHRSQLETWTEVVEDGVREGYHEDELLDAVLEVDREASMALKRTAERRWFVEKSLWINLEGIKRHVSGG